jgi:hypothetical protein
VGQKLPGLREIDLSDNCLTCAAASVMNRLPDRIYFPELFPHPLSHAYNSIPPNEYGDPLFVEKDNDCSDQELHKYGQCNICGLLRFQAYVSTHSITLMEQGGDGRNVDGDSNDAGGDIDSGQPRDSLFESPFCSFAVCYACAQNPDCHKGIPSNVAELFAAERRRRVLPSLEVLRLNGCLLGMCWTEDAGLLPTASALHGLSDAIYGVPSASGSDNYRDSNSDGTGTRDSNGRPNFSWLSAGRSDLSGESFIGGTVGMPRLHTLELRGCMARCDYWKNDLNQNHPPWPECLEMAPVAVLDSSALYYFTRDYEISAALTRNGSVPSPHRQPDFSGDCSEDEEADPHVHGTMQAPTSAVPGGGSVSAEDTLYHVPRGCPFQSLSRLTCLDISHNDLLDQRRVWIHHAGDSSGASSSAGSGSGNGPTRRSTRRYEAMLPHIARRGYATEQASEAQQAPREASRERRQEGQNGKSQPTKGRAGDRSTGDKHGGGADMAEDGGAGRTTVRHRFAHRLDRVEEAISQYYEPLSASESSSTGGGAGGAGSGADAGQGSRPLLGGGLRLVQARGCRRGGSAAAGDKTAYLGNYEREQNAVELANKAEVKGAAVIFSRGRITYIEMVKAAADAGAKLILIANDDRSGGNTFAEMNLDGWHRYNVPVLQVTYNCAVSITQMEEVVRLGHTPSATIDHAGQENRIQNRIHLTVEGMRGLTMLSRLIEEGGLPGLKELYLSGMESRIWRQKFVDLATEKDFALEQ